MALSFGVEAQITSSEEYDTLLTKVASMDKSVQLKTLIDLGKYQSEKNPKIALELLNRAALIAKRLDKFKEETDIIRLKGVCFDYEKKYRKALDLYNLSLERGRVLGDSSLVIKALHNMAFTYYKLEDYEKAIQYHFTNIKINQLIDDKDLGYTYNHLGLVYRALGESEKADAYFLKSVEIREKINHVEGLGYSYFNLGISNFRNKKDYNSGLEYIDKSSSIFFRLGDTLQYANTLNTKANILLEQQKYDSAKTLYLQAIALSSLKGDWESVIQEYLNLGLAEAEQDNLPAAEKFYLKALAIAQEKDVKSLDTWVKIYDKLHRAAYFQDNFKEAFSHLGDYFINKEKLTNKISRKRIANLESRYELEKKESDLALIKQEKFMVEERAKASRLLFTLAILILVIILSFSLCLNRVTTRKNKLIEERSTALLSVNEELKTKNDELDRFVYTVAHDLKSPLNSALSLINLMRLEKLSPTIEESINLQEKKLNGLSSFISELLIYTKASENNLSFQAIDLKKLVMEVLEKMQQDLDFEEVRKDILIPPDTIIYSDYQKVKSIFLNLITNAVRYRNKYIDGAFIKISAHKETDFLHVKVEDNGLGIRKENLEKIFEKFYRANELVEGTGLGLAIVKENVLKLKGDIKVTSTINQGTCFDLYLPYNSETKV